MSGAVGSVLSNAGALAALNGIVATQRAGGGLEAQLSTGLKINSPADNPAGFITAQGLTSQVSGLTQASRNANEGISLLQTAQGAVSQQEAILQKLDSIAVQAANGTETPQSRQSLQGVVNDLLGQMNSIAQQTQFNNRNLLDGTFTGVQFQVGANEGQTLDLSIPATLASAFVTPGTKSSGGSFQSQINTNTASAMFQGGNTAALENGYPSASGASMSITGSKGTAGVPLGEFSAKSLASAINAQSSKTGVSAQVVPEKLTLSVSNPNPSKAIQLEISGSTNRSLVEGYTASSLAAGINASNLGVSASVNSSGDLVLSNASGGSFYIGETQFVFNKSSANSLTEVGTNGATIPSPSGGPGYPVYKKITNYFPTATAGSGGTLNAFMMGEVKLTSKKSFSLGGGQYIGLQDTSKQVGAIGGGSSTLAGISVLTQGASENAITTIQSALSRLSGIQGYLGAEQQRFQATVNNLTSGEVNAENGLATVQDANIPKIAQKLTENQIQLQAGVSALKSSNALQQTFLSLVP